MEGGFHLTERFNVRVNYGPEEDILYIIVMDARSITAKRSAKTFAWNTARAVRLRDQRS